MLAKSQNRSPCLNLAWQPWGILKLIKILNLGPLAVLTVVNHMVFETCYQKWGFGLLLLTLMLMNIACSYANWTDSEDFRYTNLMFKTTKKECTKKHM